MFRLSWSILLANGSRFHLIQGTHESRDEFRGRALCEIEDRIRKVLGTDQIPAGTRFARWEHYGHPIRKFWSNGMGEIAETTGEPYADRIKIIRPLVDEGAARTALRLPR